jgi:hypothetical protein
LAINSIKNNKIENLPSGKTAVSDHHKNKKVAINIKGNVITRQKLAQ